MKNFGIRDLVVVDPQGAAATDLASPDTAGLAETARRLAVHSDDILDGSRIVPTVAEAVADAAYVAGTSMRLGQKRKGTAVLPEQLFSRIDTVLPLPVAILFGNERFGLSDDELTVASEVVAIPSDPQCPSLNLSHAVGVICYALFRSQLGSEGTVRDATGLPIRDVLSRQGLQEVIAGIEEDLNLAGFHTQEGPQGMRAFLSDILGRAGLDQSEAARIQKLFRSLSGLARKS
jgi:tRNA/rRNA methyltransferase